MAAVSLATLSLAALCLADLASAKPWWMRGVESNESDFLPPDVAFHVAAAVEGGQVRLHWVIADGYYLYRRKIDIQPESPGLSLAAPVLPRGIIKVDPYFGSEETYEGQVDGTVAFTRSDAGAHPLQIKVTYQGCAKAGLCYPPINKVLYPGSPPPPVAGVSHPWVGGAIIAGGLAFLSAGLLLRKGRTLDRPAA